MRSSRYEAVAKAIGVSICSPLCDELNADITGSVIHVHRERFTHAGVLELLFAAYRVTEAHPWFSIQPTWLGRWRRVVWVNQKATEAKVRLPRKVWEHERAKLREEISRYTASTSQRPYALAQAGRWASRRTRRFV